MSTPPDRCPWCKVELMWVQTLQSFVLRDHPNLNGGRTQFSDQVWVGIVANRLGDWQLHKGRVTPVGHNTPAELRYARHICKDRWRARALAVSR